MAWQLARKPTPTDTGPGVEPAGVDLVPWGVGIGAVAVRAVGTSAACGLAIALASAAGFAWLKRVFALFLVAMGLALAFAGR